MRQQFLLLLIAASMIMLSCQKEGTHAEESLASSANSNKNTNNSVPFHGNYITTAELLAGPAEQRITGHGQATHLGQSIFVALAFVNFSVPPPFPFTGTATFTAANGDEFYTQFTGTSTPTGSGTSRGDITHTIIGGTGRFENATGNVTGIALVNVANPTNTVSYTGTINY